MNLLGAHTSLIGEYLVNPWKSKTCASDVAHTRTSGYMDPFGQTTMLGEPGQV